MGSGSGTAAYYDLGAVYNQSNDVITVGGNLTLNGNPIHIKAPSTNAGLDTTADYVLFKVTGSITGNPISAPVWDVKPTNFANFTVNTNAHQVVLHFNSSTAQPPTGVGSVNPSILYDYQTGQVTVTATPGTSPTITSVVLNAGSIGLSSALTLVLSGRGRGLHQLHPHPRRRPPPDHRP